MSRFILNVWTLCLGLRCLGASFDIQVEVLDEDGAAIAGAAVFCDSVPRIAPDPWNAPARRVRVEATANEHGKVRMSGEHALPELVIGAVAPGFHAAACRTVASANAVRVVLPRRLGAVSSVQLELLTRALPDDGAEHGFDLALGAFTPPLGIGRKVDVWLRGRCPSASLPKASSVAYVDEVTMRFAETRTGVVAVPRPGQPGFAESVSPACAGMLLPDLLAPRQAPQAGYLTELTYRSARGPSPVDVPAPGRIDAPQWIFRISHDSELLHGVITDFGWMPDGRLRIIYRISTEPRNVSLDFGR